MLVTFFYKLKGKIMSTKQRAHVTLKDFLRVTIAERDTVDNVTDDATEFGMTPASFKQRLLTELKSGRVQISRTSLIRLWWR